MIQFVNTVTTPQPPFHPPTLTLSLLPLFRAPLNDLITLVPTMQARIPADVVAHLLAYAIEDMAGLRASKAEERRRRNLLKKSSSGISGSEDEADFESGNMARPSVRYTKELLCFRPSSSNRVTTASASSSASGTIVQNDVSSGLTEEAFTKMAFLKLSLLASMMRYKSDLAWRLGDGRRWTKDVETALRPETDEIDGEFDHTGASAQKETYRKGVIAVARTLHDR